MNSFPGRALAVVTLFCMGNAAPAAAGVITYATSNLIVPQTGNVYGITYGYNAASVGSGVGFGVNNTLGGCTCSGSGMGTTDTSGLLTASYDQTSALATNGDGSTFSSAAYAVANLASGSVGVAASGTAYQNVGGQGVPTRRRTTPSISQQRARDRATPRI